MKNDGLTTEEENHEKRLQVAIFVALNRVGREQDCREPWRSFQFVVCECCLSFQLEHSFHKEARVPTRLFVLCR